MRTLMTMLQAGEVISTRRLVLGAGAGLALAELLGRADDGAAKKKNKHKKCNKRCNKSKKQCDKDCDLLQTDVQLCKNDCQIAKKQCKKTC